MHEIKASNQKLKEEILELRIEMKNKGEERKEYVKTVSDGRKINIRKIK